MQIKESFKYIKSQENKRKENFTYIESAGSQIQHHIKLGQDTINNI